MIRKRNEKNEKVEIIDNSPETNSEILENKFFYKQKTYKEDAINTLNILEKEYGVNIYDPNNKPGMYLRKKNQSSIIPDKLKEKFLQNNIFTSKETEEKIPDNLLNHFKNNRNNGK